MVIRKKEKTGFIEFSTDVSGSIQTRTYRRLSPIRQNINQIKQRFANSSTRSKICHPLFTTKIVQARAFQSLLVWVCWCVPRICVEYIYTRADNPPSHTRTPSVWCLLAYVRVPAGQENDFFFFFLRPKHCSLSADGGLCSFGWFEDAKIFSYFTSKSCTDREIWPNLHQMLGRAYFTIKS